MTSLTSGNPTPTFTLRLYKGSESEWLVKLITPMWERSQCYRLKWKSAKEDVKRRAGEHYAILAACESQNPLLASTEMYNHLALTANSISKDMGQGDVFPLRALPAKRSAVPKNGNSRK